MIHNQVSLSILLWENHRVLDEYRDNDGNVFVEGRKKSTFAIRLQNHSSIRRKVIVSVDGLSVIEGQPASDKSSGYVLEPYGMITIDGWRNSQSSVNQFFFDKLEKSYSNSMGYGKGNAGVIGAMVFNEYRNDAFHRGMTYVDNSVWGGGYVKNTPTSAVNFVAQNSIGTGFGDELYQPAQENTTYQFIDRPATILTVYYDDREGLEKRGIVVDRYKNLPNAFPEYQAEQQFAKRPPTKRG